jgi:hypothetical protein
MERSFFVAARERSRGDLDERRRRLWLPLRVDGRRRLEQQDVVGVDHRGVGGVAVLRPDGPVVERPERAGAVAHAAEAAQPDEPVREVEVAELSQDPHAALLLGFEEAASSGSPTVG